jgi:hypothetical protein
MAVARIRALMLALAAVAWTGAAWGAELAPARGAVLVTVAGKIANHNRGAFDPFADAFLKFHDKSFDAALELDREALAALDQVEITADAEPWPGPVRLRGPRLADVLELAGARGDTVTLFALDGYGARVDAAMLAAHPWVLAIEADGRPLAIGGRGPAWLAYDTGTKRATPEEEGAWVWSVFHITVE